MYNNLIYIYILQFGDYVYWTDWQSQQIERADKHTGKHRETIKQLFVGLMDIEVVSPYRQTGLFNFD
jgi:low density lipoprotein receptor-related protein 5/6